MRRSDSDSSDDLHDDAAARAAARRMLVQGSRFGRYVVAECIAHGGMARIYRAEHDGLRRPVALKILTVGAVPDEQGRARFMQEARIAAAIKHPNVVDIYDVGVEEGVPYLVMELLFGKDLDARLRAEGALSESAIVEIAIPIVAGLTAVHDADVVHRDLKPGNIFLSSKPNGEIEPKLLDFGISKTASEDQRLTLTGGKHLIGTLLYMSPEAISGDAVTKLSDQYSLGVLLYECATGVNPFIADSVAESIRRITTGNYRAATEQAISPSRRLASILARAMNTNPTRRFPDVRALGHELLGLADQRTRTRWGSSFDAVVDKGRQRTTATTLASSISASPTPQGGSRARPALVAVAISGWAAAAAALVWNAANEIRAAAPSAAQSPLAASSAPPAQQIQALKPLPAPTPAASPADAAAESEKPRAALQADAGRADSRQPSEGAPRDSHKSRPLPGWLQELELAPSRAGVDPEASPDEPPLDRGTNEAPIFD